MHFTEGELEIDLLSNTWVERVGREIKEYCKPTAIDDTYGLQAWEFIQRTEDVKASLGTVQDAIEAARVIKSS